MNVEEECSICLEKIKDDTYVLLDCNHLIHYECVKKWVKTHKDETKLCPFCQKKGEIKNIYEIKKNDSNDSNDSNKKLCENNKNNVEDEPISIILCCNIL